MKPVRLTAAAERDLADAGSYLEKEQKGLGVQFIERINQAIEKIARTPLAYATVIKDARKIATRQFRYNVWYRVFV